MRIGVAPDVAAIGQVTVGFPFGEGRIGEQRGGQRLQRQPGAEFLRHVGFARIVEIHLDGAGAQHHVEAQIAHLGHVPHHDVVAPLGHHRQFFTRLVGPHAQTEEADIVALADFLDLREVAPGLRAGIVQVLKRCARQFELASGFEADRAIAALHCDDLAAFLDRLPTELAQRQQDIADATVLFIGQRAVFLAAIDELFMLGSDAPVGFRLLAALHRGNQLVAVFDNGIFRP